MIRYSLANRAFAAVIAMILLTSASADDKIVYESLSDVPIGRVFFTADERARMDQRRGSVPGVRAVRGAATALRKRRSVQGAGYIIGSDGRKRIYSDGSFVSSDDGDVVVFPGSVKVVRGAKKSASGEDDD